VGTPVGGTQEILRRFDPGFLFAGTDADSMAARLLERLPQVEQAGELRERCRRFVVENYSWQAIIPRIEALMAEAARARARSTLFR